MHLHRGNIFLVGMPGIFKSTLGSLLDKRLNKA
jgi:shikimate kinase